MGQDPSDAEAVEVAGKPLSCAFCRNSTFWQRSVQMHGAVASFFNLEFLGPNADCYVCAKCGHVHWFMPVADR